MICLPIMLAEFVVGRRSHANTYGAFSVLAPGSKWPVIGIITVATASIILAFYSVVGGWTADYLVMALTFNLPDSNATSHFFREVTASPLRTERNDMKSVTPASIPGLTFFSCMKLSRAAADCAASLLA